MGRTITIFLVCLCGAVAARAQDLAYSVNGLEQPAEIIVDDWGVPHIYAGTHYDAFFVQGFNAARDRLWQIDLWRRRGLGLLSDVFGEQYLEQDRAARLFLYRGDMYREWLAYGSDAKRIAEAFTAGINAYIDLIDANPELMPPEFMLLGYRPSPWAPADIVRIRSHGLVLNVRSEVRRAHIVCRAGLEVSGHWKLLEPDWTTRIPDGLDPCDIPDDVLDTYDLATSGVSFGEQALASRDLPMRAPRSGVGSNNWVVSPSRTSTGRPILANDPHRTHSVPSLRYISHLVAPGLNVIGAGEPALPGISIGHNERIAFGLTIFAIDQEDLYVYQSRRGRYRYDGEAEPFRSITESIPVRGRRPARVELKFTRHGPVIYEQPRRAFAVRSGWLEPGMAPYFGSIDYMRASNWREFSAALNRWGAPPENQVYADIDGNIGYRPAGLFPRRPNWDGLLPVPGDGRYEWDGFHDHDVLPQEHNPERGFTGSANSMNLPEDYATDEYQPGFEWAEHWRYERIWKTLEEQAQHTLAGSSALQRDYLALAALEVIRRIPADAGGPAVDMLRDWDGVLLEDSAPGALYMIWLRQHLQVALATYLHPDDPGLVYPLDTRNVLRLLDDPDLGAIVVSSLDRAYDSALSMLGDAPTEWRWGDLHFIHFKHPLEDLADSELALEMTIPAFSRGGNGNTTNDTGIGGPGFVVGSGASYRQVFDVGNWDAATMTNAPGQSGDPRSRFYDNLVQDWANDGDFPLLYSREAILEHKAFAITLTPARDEGD